MATIESEATPNWRTEGVRIIPRDALDTNTPQTPGMTRAAAVTHDRTGSEKLWAGTATIHPGAKTGAHHHGELESVIYVIRGRARMRWGSNLEFTAEAGPGGFIFLPRGVPHAHRRVTPNVGRFLVMTTPGGFDGFFRMLADADRAGTLGPETYTAASAQYGITWLS